MAKIAAHGIGCEPPKGWDSEIYRRTPDLPAPLAGALSVAPETPMPILHLANFPLPAERGDYGGGAVEAMGSGGVFISILEHHPSEAGASLFKGKGVPWPLDPNAFDPNAMQRRLGGQAGLQSFFVAQGRPFCLYVVIGSYRQRTLLTKIANDSLATLTFDP